MLTKKSVEAVSYTHLDVYKRQIKREVKQRLPADAGALCEIPGAHRVGQRRFAGQIAVQQRTCADDGGVVRGQREVAGALKRTGGGLVPAVFARGRLRRKDVYKRQPRPPPVP